MKKIVLIFVLVFIQIAFCQEDYNKYRPIEPLYESGDIRNFYDYLAKSIDKSKFNKNDRIIIAFVLDPIGKMNHIKVAFCENKEVENELIIALQNAKNWDMSNQKEKSLFVCYKIKLHVIENQLSAIYKTIWLKNEINDVNIDIDEFKVKKNLFGENLVFETSNFQYDPNYPGGIEIFRKMISENFHVPNDKKFVGGKIIVSLMIEKDGSISDIKVLKHLGFNTDEEIIRVIKLSERWIPGEANGELIRASFLFKISIE